MPSLNLSDTLRQSFGRISLEDLLSALVTLVICLVVIRVVSKLLRKLLGNSKLDARIQKYILSGVKALLYLLTALVVMETLNIQMTSLVALLSVASLGITLAAEDILSNMAGGLVLLSSHPFALGDFIEVSSTSGTVQEISLNHTKLMTPDGLLVMLPNKDLAGSKVINYTTLGRRRITQKVTASYDAPTETVKAACLEAVAMTDKVLDDPAPAVYLSNYGESAIEYTVYCWSQAPHYLEVYFALGEHLRTAFEAHHVEMTYNHLKVHIVEQAP